MTSLVQNRPAIVQGRSQDRWKQQQTGCIVFGTNNSLNFRPQLNLVMYCMAVEETKLLGVILDGCYHGFNI
jgi:hypothetical protein